MNEYVNARISSSFTSSSSSLLRARRAQRRRLGVQLRDRALQLLAQLTEQLTTLTQTLTDLRLFVGQLHRDLAVTRELVESGDDVRGGGVDARDFGVLARTCERLDGVLTAYRKELFLKASLLDQMSGMEDPHEPRVRELFVVCLSSWIVEPFVESEEVAMALEALDLHLKEQ